MWGKRTCGGLLVATVTDESLLETILAKEAKDRTILLWKTPRLS